MAKISQLLLEVLPDGSEAVEMVKNGITRRGTLGGLVGASVAPHVAAAQIARDQAADIVLPHNIFVAQDLAAATAAGEATVGEDTYFKAVGTSEGVSEVRVRTTSGSDLLYTEITKAALESPDPGKGAALVKKGKAIVRDILFVTPNEHGAAGDGVTNDTAAFTAARSTGKGRYAILPGTYVLDATPSVWEDNFFAPYGGVTLKIDGVDYDISGAMVGGFRQELSGDTYMYWRNAATGKNIARWSNGASSVDSHIFYLPFDIRRDSHVFMASPETNSGAVDFLWRRSQANTDPGGNRFAFNYEEASDRYLMTFATTAAGSPGFDAAYTIYAGTSPRLEFNAIRADFLQGWSVKRRSGAADRFDYRITPGATDHTLSDGATGQVLGTVNRSRHRLAGVSFNTLRDAPTDRDGSQRYACVLSDVGGDQTAPLTKALWAHTTRPNNRVGGILRIVDAVRGTLIQPFDYDGTTVTMGTAFIDTLTASDIVTVSLAKSGSKLVLSVSTIDSVYTIDVNVDYGGAGR